MSTALIPDWVGETIAMFSGSATVTAAVPATAIGGELDPSASGPRRAIVVTPAGGLPRDAGPLVRRRIDVRYYGVSVFDAWGVWRAVHPVIMPRDPDVIVGYGHVRDVQETAGPLPLRDPDTGFWFVLMTYSLLVQEVE